MATIRIIDPVTRIEGHLGVEVTIDGGQVTDAKCVGTLFRGFELILKDRHPWDASIITQRICGVCPISHGLAAVLAQDAVGSRTAPTNARILRNLTLGANYVQSHILHFYLLAALDYLRGPQNAPWSPAWDVDIRVPDGSPLLDHYVQSLEARRRAHEMGSVFGGRMPTSHAYIPGGFTAVPSAALIAKFREHLLWLTDFIENVYIPDVQTVGSVYSDYFSIGAGHKNLLAYGVFDQDAQGNDKLLKRGLIQSGAQTPENVDINLINEAVKHSWYKDTPQNLNPSVGVTEAVYPKTDAYSWLKAPRYNGKPFEVGPLARMWMTGDYRSGISVMDRHVARALETLKVAQAMNDWLDQLVVGSSVYDNANTPANGEGVGLTEAPRGALGHWVKILNGKIANYQIITPTCWNASPMDDLNVKGPMEQALIGTPIENPDQPIEVLRVIHSFDPCLSCAVHIMRPKKEPLIIQTSTC